ncbi:hypothetical protein E4U43_000637 [Claviceps pusilla]|uniref:FHA domain-containing protein n=1 Tax=Claviceps pusilla TaxID=123648 RepID=A0A9P7N9G3_9HYPO|nr:hypothetical protein E4U43_000637 [Claviceps pusilla]
MGGSTASAAPVQTHVAQPVARLEYICCRDDRVTKGMISLREEDIFKIGRDPASNDFAIKSDRESLVSRNHCEIYTVVYEPGINFIYVRDRKSFNGTYVNSMLVGKGPDLCSGFLLEDGDTIQILPYWKFILHQENSPPKVELSKIQLVESRFVIIADESYKKQTFCDNCDTTKEEQAEDDGWHSELSGTGHQTPAIDMWAVGIVTAIMLTASLETDGVIAKLCRSNQDVILHYLKCDIFRPDLKLSKNSKMFVWQCLQRSPQKRLSVLEAECHDWLCTPEEHLQFFKQLDRKVLCEWKIQTELSPMPLQLPSVLMSSMDVERDQNELFKSYLSYGPPPSPSTDGISASFSEPSFQNRDATSCA